MGERVVTLPVDGQRINGMSDGNGESANVVIMARAGFFAVIVPCQNDSSRAERNKSFIPNSNTISLVVNVHFVCPLV